MKLNKKLLTLILITIPLGLVGCNNAKANEVNVISVGMATNNAPFVSTKHNNEYSGFDIDILNLLENELNVKFKINDTPKIGLIPGLKSSEYDIVVSGLNEEDVNSISKDVLLSDNYYSIEDYILYRTNDKSIKSKKDLHNKVVGVEKNSLQKNSILDLNKDNIIPKNIVEYSNDSECINDLQNGKIDAVVVDSAFFSSYDFEDVSKLKESLAKRNLVIVANDNDDELISSINAGIKSIKNNDSYKKVIDKWFK
ncbi:MAG: amino acid ABC transporter substrate-binding protein [Romboutsia sp.]|nr:amino acid ABC transporter substrate-binding protein [Romboutsia sp.]